MLPGQAQVKPPTTTPSEGALQVASPQGLSESIDVFDVRSRTKRTIGVAEQVSTAKGRTFRLPDGSVSSSPLVPFSEQYRPPAQPARDLVQEAIDTKAINDAWNKAVHMQTPPAKQGFSTGVSTVIINNDTRGRATPTTGYPRNAIGYLHLENTAIESECSGVLYGANTIVTTAHCLYDKDRGGWKLTNFFWQRARDGGAPFGTCFLVSAIVYTSWTTNPSISNDVGAVKLDCSVPGSFGNGYYPLVNINNPSVQVGFASSYVIGYPGEKSGQQWEGQGQVLVDPGSGPLKYTIDTSSGQSGGLVAIFCQSYGWYVCSIGVHSEGFTGSFPFFFDLNLGHKYTAGDIAMLANFRDN
jgi:V8-like Glu-specific endopeptidase